MDAGIGPYVVVSFYHKRSQTLLVTNVVIYVPKQPRETIIKEALIAVAKNGLAVRILRKGKNVMNVSIVDNKETRKKG